MMDSTSILNNINNTNDLKRDPLQSPVFKLRGLEMTVYGLEKENLELRQKIETQEKEINNFHKLISEYEFENGQHERRHAQLEEEILELRKQLKQYTNSGSNIHSNSFNNSNNSNNNNINVNNNNSTSNTVERDLSQMKIHDKEKEKLISEDLYLYTGRSFPSSPGTQVLANSTSFNSNHSVNLNESNNNIDHSEIPTILPNTPTITTNNSSNNINNNNNNNNSGSTRSPFQKGNNNKPPSSPTIVSCVSDGVSTGVNISMSPSPVIPQPRKKSIISLFSL
ncbi:hypothetical protein DLAC_02738 [Tieghemostelium lacteum]|uniref:Uncharacterized protein n=1 Tax=Tieghemostelium lacteum TaxID=361077 RepID=A0A152A3B3_TIELA|nr:hypothetical protein DLAC_02738 [Tieghemostelium lacteum]|eukprot:KYR00699.1 hypothetical protein DLAC_02738 [Tieghemostelium lacteum]